MSEDDTVGPLRALAGRLRDNRVVSITVNANGRRTRPVGLLDGTIEVATGTPALAWQTGAPLLPVFTVREPAGGFVTRIEAPLRHDPALPRAAAIDALLADYAARLEAAVLQSPDQLALPYVATVKHRNSPRRSRAR